jgi:hypothetical protein
MREGMQPYLEQVEAVVEAEIGSNWSMRPEPEEVGSHA